MESEYSIDALDEALETSLVSSRRTFFLSAIIGAYGGISLLLLVLIPASFREPVPLELWTIVQILIFGTFALPFVIIGLAIFGLPAAYLLRSKSQEWWVAGVALISGALAGKLMFYPIDHLLFFGVYPHTEFFITDCGMIFGVSSALAWWALQRRRLASA